MIKNIPKRTDVYVGDSRGQVMMIVVMVLSAAMIGATGIAGILTARQIRQTVDAGNFSKVLFAADSGLEWRLYKYREDGYACQIDGEEIDCLAENPDHRGAACESKPNINGIALLTYCKPRQVEVGGIQCPVNSNCWTISSSASNEGASYVYSFDIKD